MRLASSRDDKTDDRLSVIGDGSATRSPLYTALSVTSTELMVHSGRTESVSIFSDTRLGDKFVQQIPSQDRKHGLCPGALLAAILHAAPTPNSLDKGR
jgi:hypothetical protein